MSTGKYRVRLMRPVFQAVVVEVKAPDEKVAMNIALHNANTIPDAEWKGSFDPEAYAYDVQYVMDMDDDHNEEDADFIFYDTGKYRQYALLKADTNTGEGTVLFQPWMSRKSDLMIAGLCMDWSATLDKTRDQQASRYYERLISTAPAQQGIQAKAKVIPFRRPDKKRS